MKIKLTFWRVVFLVIMALGLYSTYVRYLRGLGAVSNMTDQFPWGFWIGFDCLCGVMLAAGGFCMVGAVYLFNVESLRSVVRPAVLTAFLGYLLFIVGLLFDLGRPWFIWHQLIYMMSNAKSSVPPHTYSTRASRNCGYTSIIPRRSRLALLRTV